MGNRYTPIISYIIHIVLLCWTTLQIHTEYWSVELGNLFSNLGPQQYDSRGCNVNVSLNKVPWIMIPPFV